MKADLIPLLYPGISSEDPFRLYVSVSRLMSPYFHREVGDWKDRVNCDALLDGQPPVDWYPYDIWPSEHRECYLVINRHTLQWWVFINRGSQRPTATILNQHNIVCLMKYQDNNTWDEIACKQTREATAKAVAALSGIPTLSSLLLSRNDEGGWDSWDISIPHSDQPPTLRTLAVDVLYAVGDPE